jgi:hypothetical protein
MNTTLKKIAEIVFAYFEVDFDLMDMETRKREIVLARQVAHYFAKRYTKYSLAVIGRNIGGKDHATVLHSNRAVLNLIDTDRHFANQIKQLDEKVRIFRDDIATDNAVLSLLNLVEQQKFIQTKIDNTAWRTFYCLHKSQQSKGNLVKNPCNLPREIVPF